MDKIEILLGKLDNRIPASLAKRLDTLDDLNEKLEVAKAELEEENNQENQDAYDDILDYIKTYELSIIEDMEKLVASRAESKKEKEEVKTEVKTETPTPETKTDDVKPEAKTEETQSKEKEGSGMFGLILGGVLLVASLGAVNYFRNNR